MAIKVALSHPTYPSGGLETVTSDMAADLVARGYRVWMFVEDLRCDQLRERDRANITFIPTRFSGRGGGRAAARAIAAKIDEEGIDIFVAPMGWHLDLPLLRSLTKAKIVFALHSVPLWETLNFMAWSTRKALTSRSVGKMAEWFLVRAPHELLTRKRRRAMVERNREMYRSCDLYTVLTEEYKTRMIEILGPGLATAEKNHIEVIPNWIPPTEGAPDVGAKQPLVLYVGRLSRYDKRVDRLIKIWREVAPGHPDWRLRIVGGGEERERLAALARKLGVAPSVEFVDFTPDPAPHYRQASILCLTSTVEGWGLVISEAQQAGVVPVAFDCSAGVHVQIAPGDTPNGVNGVLVAPFDKKAFARELAALMDDPVRRARIAANAVARAAEYSDPKRLARWDEVFKKLLNR